MSSDGDLAIALASEQVLEGKVHPGFAGRPELGGRAVDLSKAYKQVAIHPSSRQHTVLGVRSKEARCVCSWIRKCVSIVTGQGLGSTRFIQGGR